MVGYNIKHMQLVSGVVGFLLLVILLALRVPHPELSRFELRRRARSNDERAVSRLAAAESGPVIEGLVLLLALLLSVAVSGQLMATLGWLGGSFAAVSGIVGAYLISHTRLAIRLSGWCYARCNDWVMGILGRYPSLCQFLSRPVDNNHPPLIGSVAELEAMLRRDKNLPPQVRDQLGGVLDFSGKTVADVMLPREKIISLSDDEMLGPLVLHELHETGQEFFPVIKGGRLDVVVGFVSIRRWLSLDNKRTITAGRAVDYGAVLIDQKRPLVEALDIMLSDGYWAVVAVDADKKTAGLLTLPAILRVIFRS